MKVGRAGHGLIKIDQAIYVFGGGKFLEPTNSAKVYSIIRNTWKMLPNMPECGSKTTWVRL